MKVKLLSACFDELGSVVFPVVVEGRPFTFTNHILGFDVHGSEFEKYGLIVDGDQEDGCFYFSLDRKECEVVA